MQTVLFQAAGLHPDHCTAFHRRKCCREMDGFYFWRFASTGPESIYSVQLRTALFTLKCTAKIRSYDAGVIPK